MLDWLSSGKGATIPELLAKKKYSQAIALLQDELKRRPHDERTQMQLAEVYVLDGRTDPAVRILTALADDLAARGFAAKAIAVLKKVQKLDPAQHVEQKLARLIRESLGEPAAAPRSAPAMGAAIDLDFQSMPEPPAARPAPPAPAAPRAASPQPKPEPPPPPAPPPRPVPAPPPFVAEPEPAPDFQLDMEPAEDFSIGLSVDETPSFLRPPDEGSADAPVIDFVEPETESGTSPVVDFLAPEPEPVIDFVSPEPEPVIDFVSPEPEPVIDFVAPEPEPVIDFVETESEPVADFFVADDSQSEVETIAIPEPEPEPHQPRARTGDIDADLFAALPDDTGEPMVSSYVEQPRPTQKKIALFADFSNDDLAVVIQELDLHSFSAGDIIFSEGQVGDSLFVIASGGVKCYGRQPDNTNVLMRELSEGDFFGEIALFTGKPRTATVIAASPCDLLELTKPAYDRISATHPSIKQVLMQFYTERAQTATESAVREIEIEEGPESDEEVSVVQEEEPIVVQVEEPSAPQVSDEEQRALRAISIHDAALEATRAGQWSAALPMWREYVSLKPDDLQAMSVIGIVSGKLELWDEAASAFRLAIKHAPTDATLYFNLGFAFGKMEKWPEAVYAYEEAVRLKPDYAKAKQSLTRAQGHLKNLK